MNIEKVAERLDEIRRYAYDDEKAHSLEDDLRSDVLRAVADGHPDSAALAKLALTSALIPFKRWCA